MPHTFIFRRYWLPEQLWLPGFAPQRVETPSFAIAVPPPSNHDLARYSAMNLTDDDAYDLHRETYR